MRAGKSSRLYADPPTAGSSMPKSRAALPSDLVEPSSAPARKARDAGSSAPNPSSQPHGVDSQLKRADRRSYKRKCLILLAALLVLCAVSLPLGASTKALYGFDQVLLAFRLWVQTTFDAIASGAQHSSRDLLEICPGYYQILARFAITGIGVACGAMIALSGALYQMVFRNPIAAPTMLGVGNGITLGVVVLVVVFGAAAPYMVGMRYLFCYIGAIAVLAIVVALAMALGRGHVVVVDMLLVGTVVSALVGQIVIFYAYSVFDEDTWAVFNAINEMLDVSTEPLSLVVLAISFAVSVVPVLLLRFKLNVVAFDEADMRLSGVDPTRLRFIALACGTVMIISAQVQLGTIAMVALVAPYVARSVFGAEFTKQFWGAALIGALLVVACNDVTALAEILVYSHDIYLDFPIGLAANIVCLPLFAWVIAAQNRAWEQ